MQAWVEFPLTKGKVALVDVSDLLILARYRWYADKSCSHGVAWYARRTVSLGSGRTRAIGMHRWIMEPPPGMVVDHINGDGLDNRRANLRLATVSQNGANRRGRIAGTKAKYIGVSKDPRHRNSAWRFRIFIGEEAVRGGGFATAEDAARAYDAAAIKAFGAFAKLNFPEDS